VIAATNRNLADEVAESKFREDLYYRLNVITIEMPPLRERPGDLNLLVEHFLDKHRLTPLSPPAKISEEAMAAIERHDWPGNVRELENAIARAVVLAQGGVITSQHLLLGPTTEARVASRRELEVASLLDRGIPLPETLAQVERQLIMEAMRRSDWVELPAAGLLGIEVDTLLSKLRQYGIGVWTERSAA
jgi:two-component system response regulator AtoC